MKIAIVGYGLEGKASYEYWHMPGNELTIVDERSKIEDLPNGANTILGPDSFSKLEDFDLIIRSPSVHPKKLPYGGKVWSATNEFFEECPAPIIGVTGTKGKGTTSSLIASILKATGRTVHLVGNIGTPALTELPKVQASHVVVFELSSFQLWDLQKSPHVAVVLGIEPDHLDIHDSMEDYVKAKANITRYQTENDVLVFNASNDIAKQIAENSVARKMWYPFGMAEYVDALAVPGPHNIENAAAAIAATNEYTQNRSVIRQGLASFTGLPHRIKFVREVNSVKYYDDSYSSAPSASLAALKSFTEPRVILLGGIERKADFTELASYVASNESVKVVVYGANRDRLVVDLRNQSVDDSRIKLLETTNFESIVKTAAEWCEPDGVVILSPGCASFDMFKNFTDRGEKFIRIVESL